MCSITHLSQILSRLIALSILTLSAISVYGQLPPINSDIFFQTYTKEDGLSNNTVNCFEEDEAGFIWIGTLDGLSKFNGEDFVHYHNGKDSTTLHNDEINELLYLDNDMWIGTADGLIQMDIEREAFITHHLPNKDQYSNTIESLVKVGNTLWVGYEANGSLSGALAIFSIAEEKFISVSSDAGLLDNVHYIYPDPHDEEIIWVLSTELYLTDRNLTKITPLSSPLDIDPSRRGLTHCFRLNENYLLVSSTNGLYTYQPSIGDWSSKISYNSGESESVFSPNYIKSMTQQDSTSFLLNTYDLGLLTYDHTGKSFSRFHVSNNDPFEAIDPI